MINTIKNEAEYSRVIKIVEQYLKEATIKSGFGGLNKKDIKKLKNLTLLAEDYEDHVLKIMPVL